MDDSSYFKSMSSRDELEENLNDAVLLSSDDEIFYDTNEHSVSCESILTDVSGAEGYESCSEFSENTDSTSLLSLPVPKYKLKNVPKSPQDLNNLQNQKDPKTTTEEYTNDEDVPLKVLLRRMFEEILGKYRKESSTTCSVNKFGNIVEINNNEQLYRSPENNKSPETNNCCKISTNSENFDSIILPSCSHNTTDSVPNELYPRKLITIYETSNENSDNTFYHQSTLDWSGKCVGKLPKLPFRKPFVPINDVLFVSNDTEENASSGSNSSVEIQMMSKEIYKKMIELEHNKSLNSTDQNGKSLYVNEEVINFSSVNDEECDLFRLRDYNIPSIVITPPTPD